MISIRRRIANPRIQILRGIYHDNLRIGGKCTAEDLKRAERERLYVRMRRWGMILFVAVVCTFPELSSLMDKELTQMAMVNPPVEMPDIELTPHPAADFEGHIEPDLLPSIHYAGLTSAADLIMKLPLEPQLNRPPSIWSYHAPDIQESQDYSLLISRNDHVRLSSLFGLDIKKIVIDPGHGGKDPGAIGTRGTREKDITLDVSLKLAEKLRSQGQTVLLTRDTDRKLSLVQRVEFAKSSKADIFISIHVNSLQDQTVNIIETYYFGPPLTSDILRLAEQENKESHYTIGELDGIIQDIGNTLKRQESAILAGSIQESLFRNVRNHDAQVRNFGIKMAPFVVLSQIEVPSVLVEISCLTKEEEEMKLMSAEYREKIASFIEEGIMSYLESQQSKILIGEKQ